MVRRNPQSPESDRQDHAARGGHPEPSRAGDDASLDTLRELLLSEERRRIDDVETRLERRELDPDEVGKVLPRAIESRGDEDAELGSALAPTIESAIKTSVRRNPEPITDAIFPVIGPAIRKSIADALSKLTQSMNQAIELSLSPRSIRWRLEARRTGKPFAEVLLLKTLLYRVEQVFLIHPESGLLLTHVHAPSVKPDSGDLVSALLTAVRDFGRDSFGVQGSLDEVRFGGDLVIWTEGAPDDRVLVAAAIRGTPPVELREALATATERIRADFGEEIAGFSGDTRGFESSVPILETCLAEAQREKQSGSSRLAPALIALVLISLSTWGGLALWKSIRWSAAFDALDAESGIVVHDVSSEDGRHVVTGMRDEDAVPAREVIESAGLDPSLVVERWEAYQSTEPGIVLKRARRLLEPPAGVSMRIDGGVLSISGESSAAWRDRALAVASRLFGVSAIDDSGLVAPPEGPSPDERVTAEARRVLSPPASVALRSEDGVLELDGRAGTDWIATARLRAPLIPGVVRVESDALVASDRDEVILRKVALALRPPESVTLAIQGDSLVASGAAPHAWIVDAERLVDLIDGLEAFRGDGLIDEDAARLDAARTRLEARGIEFERSSTLLSKAALGELEATAAEILELTALAQRAGGEASVTVVGEAESSGDRGASAELARRRARRVLDALVDRGAPSSRLRLAGRVNEAVSGSATRDSAGPRVSFRVELDEGESS